MDLWDKYQEFSADLVAQHYDYVLYDTGHDLPVNHEEGSNIMLLSSESNSSLSPENAAPCHKIYH